jgi:hypothetical protein
VELTGTGGEFTILIDSDAYEFTVRVSPESDNYDPANVGVESGLINADEPTFEGDHHLHLTTGDLSVTSIFLGTDDHNVRTTVDGGISMTTTRGTVLFGNVPDNPITGSSHFHIMKDDAANVDLFFGDDDNYVKLPSTQGVEVSANGSIWSFGTDGTTTFPENTIKNVADTSIKIGNPLVSGVVVATVDELIPPGDVWRLFIDSDIYPALGTTVHIGGTVTTAWGTPITATITDIQEDTNTDRWLILVAQDITAGFDAGPKTVSFAESYKTWSFGTDGALTLPNGGHIGPSGGKGAGTTYGAANGDLVSLTSYYDSGLYSSCVTAYADGTLNITAYNDGGPNPAKIWTFANDGSLTLPGDIRSEGDINIDINLSDSTLRRWTFGEDGNLTVPGDIVDSNGESFLKDIPQNFPTGYNEGVYVLQASDRGRHILIDGTEGNSIMVPTDASAPMPIGSAIVLVIKPGMYSIVVGPEDSDNMTIHGAGVSSVGYYELGAGNGGAMATLVKIGADEWMISGTGLAEWEGP